MTPGARSILAVSARRKEAAFAVHAMIAVGFTIVLTAALTTSAPPAQVLVVAGATAGNAIALLWRLLRMPQQRDLRRIVARSHAVILIDRVETSSTASETIRIVFADRSVVLLRLPLDEARALAPVLARHCPLAMNRLPMPTIKRRTPVLRSGRPRA